MDDRLAVVVGAGMSDTSKFYLILFGIIAGLAALGGGGYAVYTNYKERGIRNNNPGNLRPSAGTTWQGQSGIDTGLNGSYLIFKAPEWGIRALYKNLMTYRTKYSLTTIEGIIKRWAPPTDKNDTPAYIASVSKQIGKPANVALALTDYPALMKAIIKHENGIQPYPDDLIQKGISLA